MWVHVNVYAHRYVKWEVVGRVLAQPPALLSPLPASCYGGGEPTFWLQVWGCTVLLFCGMAWRWAAPLPAMRCGGGEPPPLCAVGWGIPLRAVCYGGGEPSLPAVCCGGWEALPPRYVL